MSADSPLREPVPIRLRDVARAAGVSTASASRALNVPDLVSPNLRARILAAAQRLGYVPNLAARALATRRSGLVGVLVKSLTEPLTTGLIDVLGSELRRAGYGMALAFADRSAGDAAVRIRELLAQGVDALLALDETGVSPEAAKILGAHGIPWLVLDEPGGEGRDAVGRRAGAGLACRYLLSLGHQRIGAFAAKRSGVETAIREALEGTPAVLLAPNPGENPDGPASLQDALADLLDRPDPATALICRNDSDAMAALRECHARGMAVPREISIIGFGDTELAKQTWPSLTSVRVSVSDIGTRTVAALMAMLRGEAAPALDPAVKLVVRESSAIAPE